MGALIYTSTPLSINYWQLVPPPESESYHDDVIKWKHFPHYWPFVWGIQWSLVNSPHKVQWCGALMTFTAQNVSTRRWCICVRFCQRKFFNSTSKYKFLSTVPLCIFIWYQIGSRTFSFSYAWSQPTYSFHSMDVFTYFYQMMPGWTGFKIKIQS